MDYSDLPQPAKVTAWDKETQTGVAVKADGTEIQITSRATPLLNVPIFGRLPLSKAAPVLAQNFPELSAMAIDPKPGGQVTVDSDGLVQ